MSASVELILIAAMLAVAYIASRALLHRAARRALRMNGSHHGDFITWAVLFAGVFLSMNLLIQIGWLVATR